MDRGPEVTKIATCHILVENWTGGSALKPGKFASRMDTCTYVSPTTQQFRKNSLENIPFPSLLPFVLNPPSPLESCYLLFLALPLPPFFNLLLLLSWRNVIRATFFFIGKSKWRYILLFAHPLFHFLFDNSELTACLQLHTPSPFLLFLFKNLSNFIYIHKLFSHSISYSLPLSTTRCLIVRREISALPGCKKY